MDITFGYFIWIFGYLDIWILHLDIIWIFGYYIWILHLDITNGYFNTF